MATQLIWIWPQEGTNFALGTSVHAEKFLERDWLCPAISPQGKPCRGHSVYEDSANISLHQLGDLDLVLVLF